ncbi:hypothetical protein PHMEG_00022230, partial [Phytophthora megakarya]
LAPRFIGPFTVIKAIGDAYTLDVPSSLHLHPTFYVGRLKRYYLAEIPDAKNVTTDGCSDQRYRRDGPPPVIDAAGNVRWIVDRIVKDQDPHGFPPEDNTWETPHGLLRDVPDVVRDYEATLAAASDSSGQPKVNENGIANGDESENANENRNPLHVPKREPLARPRAEG